MAFTGIGNFITGNSKVSESTKTFTTSNANLTAGRLGLLVIALDNTGTGDGASSEVSSVTDAAGNTWAKLAEFRNGNASAGTGVVVSLWYTVASSSLGNAANLTINLANSVTAKALTGYVLSLTQSTIQQDGTTQTEAVDAGNVGALTISGLSSLERLYVRGIGRETSAVAVSNDSNYTTGTNAQTSGGAADSNAQAHIEWRILTGTGDTNTPTNNSTADAASVFVAISEVVPASGPAAGSLLLLGAGA